MTIAPVSAGVRSAVAATRGPKPDLAPRATLFAVAIAAPGHGATNDALSGRILIIPGGMLSQLPGFFGQGGGYQGSGGGYPDEGGTRVITLPRGFRLPGGFGHMPGGMDDAPEPTPREPLPGERQAYETNIGRVQDFWTKLGVGANEGNGRQLPVEFLDNYPNASYAHDENGGHESFNIGLDRKTGKSYATATDVIAHEYAHRVVNHILGQQGEGEAGAVNESLADTFAAAVDQKNWTIGEDIRPGGIRTMDTRETKSIDLPDAGPVTVPINMRDYVDTEYDKGGVHINVGIPNKAASLIGDSIGRDNMATLYLDAVRKFMPHDGEGGIADLAKATMLASKDKFGAGSKESQAVVDAWTSVGVLGGARQEREPRMRQPFDNVSQPFISIRSR